MSSILSLMPPDSDHFYYPWAGRVGGETFPIEDWYQAECTGPGERSVSGPHRPTPQAALADAERMISGDEYHPPYEQFEIIRCSPAVRISRVPREEYGR